MILDELRRAQRVMLVHAHPDDETLATGALALELSGAGVEVQVVTATRGERGEVVPGSLPADFTGDLADFRRRELAQALARLGVRRHVFLGEAPAAADQPRRYTDSGMAWISEGLAGPAPDVEPTAFSLAPRDQVAADLAAVVAQWQPQAFVTYAADGGYGHPDHVAVHHMVAAVAAQTGLPAYAIADSADKSTEFHDLTAWEPQLRLALGSYRTQFTVSDEGIEHVGGQHQQVETWFGLSPLLGD